MKLSNCKLLKIRIKKLINVKFSKFFPKKNKKMSNLCFISHTGKNDGKTSGGKNNPCMRPASVVQYIPNCCRICLGRLTFWFYVGILVINWYFPSRITNWIILIPIILTIFTSILLDFIRYSRTNFWISKINDRESLILRNNQWVKVKWSDIQVGDIIKLLNGYFAPADFILFATDNKQQTSIETHIIDGSSQWQPKSPVEFVDLPFEESLGDSTFTITDISRNPILDSSGIQSKFNTKYNFTGTLNFNGKSYELSNKNLIERYSIIHQQEYVIGGVVYSGEDCYTVRNKRPPIRITSIEKFLRKQSLLQIFLLIFLSFLGTIYTYSYFYTGDVDFILFVRNTLMNYVIILLPIVPLELFSFIDLCLLFNGNIFQKNYEKTFVNSVESLSEIGNVDTLLISRSMLLERRPTLKRVFLNNQMFGGDISSRQLSHFIESETFSEQSMTRNFDDPALTANEETHLFFEHISLCHSASIITDKKKIHYISRFHDDEELLKLSAKNGIMLVKRNPTESVLHIDGNLHLYKTCRLIHSCTKHPRITIVVDDGKDDLLVLSRGIYKIMMHVVDKLDSFSSFYDQFHNEGFHVEVCAYKRLSKQIYENFMQKVTELGALETEFEYPIVEDMLEKNMTFLAMLGFEDRARRGSLLFLSRAKQMFSQICFATTSKGMSLFITCISLGITDSNDPVIGQIKGNSQEDVDISLTYLLENRTYDCIIITGHSLQCIATSEYAKQVNVLLKKTPVIIMQRSNYLQTAAFVEYQEKIQKKIVMAIGHSVYDVSYMNSSSISIAMPTNELKPNNVSADIIVSNYEQLASLIFVGSHLINERILSLIKFIFPKEFILAMIQFAFSFRMSINNNFLYDPILYPIMMLFSFIAVFPHCLSKESKSAEERILNVSKANRIRNDFVTTISLCFMFSAVAFIILESILFAIDRIYLNALKAVELPFLALSITFIIYYSFVIFDFEKFTLLNLFGVIGSMILYVVFMIIYFSTPTNSGPFDNMIKSSSEFYLLLGWIVLSLIVAYIYNLLTKPRRSDHLPPGKKVMRKISQNEAMLLSDS